ncbi:hypothetical protein ACQ4M3_06125 [Leptolyngbya sp. AN03gr2]
MVSQKIPQGLFIVLAECCCFAYGVEYFHDKHERWKFGGVDKASPNFL